MIWLFLSCAPKGWYDADDFLFHDEAIANPFLSEWIGEGTMDPANYLTGQWEIVHENCHIAVTIDSSSSYDSMGCNFAFALNVSHNYIEDSQCSSYPLDVAFASQEQIDMCFLWGDVLFWDGLEWQMHDVVFEQDSLNGPRNYDFVMPSFDE